MNSNRNQWIVQNGIVYIWIYAACKQQDKQTFLTMPRNKRLHFKDLDALRFFAFLPVFLYCFLKLLSIDQEGFLVDLSNIFGRIALNSEDFFFFLSAFLISSHGLREYKYRESFNLRNFLLRRLLRIAVPLIVLLIFIFWGHPWLVKMLKLQPIAVPVGSSYIIGLPNYLSNLNNDQFVYLIITWSIYMLIQFYLVWGVVLKFFKNQLMWVSIIAILIGSAARIIHFTMDSQWFFDTLSYGIPIGIGSIVAILIRQETSIIETIKQLPKKVIVVIYVAGIITTLAGYLFFAEAFASVFIPYVTCLFFGFIVIEQTYGKNSFAKFRNNKLVTHMGRITYGLIAYQSIMNVLVIIAIGSLDFDLASDMLKLLSFGATFILSWIVADVSFNLLERPLLILKKEFKKH